MLLLFVFITAIVVKSSETATVINSYPNRLLINSITGRIFTTLFIMEDEEFLFIKSVFFVFFLNNGL